jgi:hypothetical protein
LAAGLDGLPHLLEEGSGSVVNNVRHDRNSKENKPN